MAVIEVEICSPRLEIVAAWESLVARAPANVFLHPAALVAAAEASFATIHLLLAWDRSSEHAQLVGLWALQEKRPVPFLPRYLAGPAYDYAFVSSPVVDPAYAAALTQARAQGVEIRAFSCEINPRGIDAGPEIAFIHG